MGINANVSGGQQITASVGETKIDVAVSGGVGPSGAGGPAATITVGTVTTGAPGSSASVVNSGTTSAAVLNFTIPAGATGATGPQGATGPAGTTTWAGITDKPSTFPPSSHQHVAADITDFTSAVIAAAPPTTNASLLTSGTLPDARLSANIARTSDVASAVAAVVNAAPASLDTLKELADALGNDASFAATVTNSLAGKAAANHTHTQFAKLGINTPASGNDGQVVILSNEQTQQASALKAVSSQSAAGATWRGRAMFGAKNKTFLLGAYNGVAGLGAHSWTDSLLETGAEWADVAINPDGNANTLIGCTEWDTSTAILRVQNSDNAVVITDGAVGDKRAQFDVTGIGSGFTRVFAFPDASGTFVIATDSRLSDAREWSASTIDQAEAEAGTSTTRRAFTAQRVFQAIAAWWNASAAKTKLDGIATGATANATDAQLRDRATHTGTQAASTITGLASVATSGSYADLSGVPSSFAPTAHKSTHATGGTDALTPSDIGAAAASHTHSAADTTSGTFDIARLPSHATTHNPGGADPVTLVEVYEFTRTTKPAAATGSNGSYTFTIPAAAKAVEFYLIGGGGGGGSGRRGAATTARFGGGGGAAGCVTQITRLVSELSSRSLGIEVGAGGVGGAAVTANDTNGNNASAASGSQVIFGASDNRLNADRGGAGLGGTASAGTGGAAASNGAYLGAAGGNSSVTATPSGSNATSPFAAAGGGGGGGISAADASQSGAIGRAQGWILNVGSGGQVNSTGGTAPGGAGQNASAAFTQVLGAHPGGAGGGGAAGNASTAGGNGGNGANYGGAGGGGGASFNGFNSGAGGNGGDGYVRITVWY